MLQAEKVAFYTKTANCLQPYALRYECHSTKPGDEKKNIRKNFILNGRRYSENVQGTKLKV